MVKIEVGKIYRRRDGLRAVVTDVGGSDENPIFFGRTTGPSFSRAEAGIIWDLDGKEVGYKQSSRDLVEEIH